MKDQSLKYRVLLRFIPLALLLVIAPFLSLAQDDAPTLTLTDEQDTGYRCPAASALQPETDTLWVMMDNCRSRERTLHAFDRNTGELIDSAVGAPFTLDMLDGYEIDRFIAALGFTPDGALELIATNYDDETFARFQIDITSGDVTQDEEADAALNTLLGQYSEYPVYLTIFSRDHQIAAVGDEVSLRVVDLTSDNVLFEVDTAIGISAFSPDGERLYISTVNEPDNMESFEGTLLVYSVPDGELLYSHDLPFSALFPSDDGRYVAVELASFEGGKEQIAVIDVESGARSAELPISEAPRQVTTCRNDGRDVSDTDFRTSGHLSIIGLQWLADGSGFITLNSQGNQETNTGCVLDYSRLRHYAVG